MELDSLEFQKPTVHSDSKSYDLSDGELGKRGSRTVFLHFKKI